MGATERVQSPSPMRAEVYHIEQHRSTPYLRGMQPFLRVKWLYCKELLRKAPLTYWKI